MFLKSLLEIIYPRYCVTCYGPLDRSQNALCNWCADCLFSPANPNYAVSCDDIILPESIEFQHALWKYDKGGYLQEVLHALKYSNLADLGVDIGRHLGFSLLAHPSIQKDKPVKLIPVPLHPSKLKKRGYNQAKKIAQGVLSVTGYQIIPDNAILRTRKTKTQTGFSLDERQKNVSAAFMVNDTNQLRDAQLIIIDDVFTTGATTFELADSLQSYTTHRVGIATIALA